jgi:hypothetical protein
LYVKRWVRRVDSGISVGISRTRVPYSSSVTLVVAVVLVSRLATYFAGALIFANAYIVPISFASTATEIVETTHALHAGVAGWVEGLTFD